MNSFTCCFQKSHHRQQEIITENDEIFPNNLPKANTRRLRRQPWNVKEWLMASDEIAETIQDFLLTSVYDLSSPQEVDEMQRLRNIYLAFPDEANFAERFKIELGTKLSRTIFQMLQKEFDPQEDVQDESKTNEKFLDFDTLEYGSVQTYYSGLEAVIGMPSIKLKEAMKREHLEGLDHGRYFTAPNTNVETTSAIEWNFVVNPHELDSLNIESWPQAPRGDKRYPTDLQKYLEIMNEKNSLLSGQEKLTEEEVIALRLYTGPMYIKYSNTIRAIRAYKDGKAKKSIGYRTNKVLLKFIEICGPRNKKDNEDYYSEDAVKAMTDIKFAKLVKECNRYTNTLHAINSGIIKLSKLTKLHNQYTVYRGIANKNLPKEFTSPNQFGFMGGVESGFLSTSTKRDIAMNFSKGEKSIMFEIEQGMIDRGANVEWLSQYPTESEILFGPLTGIEILHHKVRGNTEIVNAKLSVNFMSSTIEAVRMKRNRLLAQLKDEEIIETVRRHYRALEERDYEFDGSAISSRHKIKMFEDYDKMIEPIINYIVEKRDILRHSIHKDGISLKESFMSTITFDTDAAFKEAYDSLRNVKYEALERVRSAASFTHILYEHSKLVPFGLFEENGFIIKDLLSFSKEIVVGNMVEKANELKDQKGIDQYLDNQIDEYCTHLEKAVEGRINEWRKTWLDKTDQDKQEDFHAITKNIYCLDDEIEKSSSFYELLCGHAEVIRSSSSSFDYKEFISKTYGDLSTSIFHENSDVGIMKNQSAGTLEKSCMSIVHTRRFKTPKISQDLSIIFALKSMLPTFLFHFVSRDNSLEMSRHSMDFSTHSEDFPSYNLRRSSIMSGDFSTVTEEDVKEWLNIFIHHWHARREIKLDFRIGKGLCLLAKEDALKLVQDLPLSTKVLKVFNCPYGEDFIDAIIEFMCRKEVNLSTLFIQDTSVACEDDMDKGRDCGARLASAVESHFTLKKLRLHHTDLIGSRNMNQWLQAFKANRTLTNLAFFGLSEEMFNSDIPIPMNDKDECIERPSDPRQYLYKSSSEANKYIFPDGMFEEEDRQQIMKYTSARDVTIFYTYHR
ncbi:hypothetical protein CTEN210_09073 [Chaetoceros tenuissimus]|uniref:ADP ribosyltransferase domain-containing protein n=1 Tax=Chaetoceros tenuissimus TaxID=426638 RepID=A0AAD3CV38_9STRA|nr:hypothetical protein CTEN210_09073 [Chaetoceros tenuissimus]